MSFAVDFRAYLLAQSAIASAVGERVHVGMVPEETEPPYLWMQRAGASHERTLDQPQGETPFEERWDLEAIAAEPDDLATLDEAIRGLDSARGDFGDGRMQALFVEDQADDYVPKGVWSDEGLDVAAYQITVYGYAPG